MIVIEAVTDNILKAKISAKLEESDFTTLAPQVDKIIQSHGSIRLLLDATAFDGWSDMQAAKKHFTFVHDHQAKVERIALIAGPLWQHWVAGIAGVFVHLEIKVFDSRQIAEAQTWLQQK